VVKYYRVNSNNIEEIDAIESGCWINIYPPFNHDAIKEISDKLGIYIEYFTDALDIDEQSRYEQDDDTKFILLNTPVRNDDLVENRASFITIPISIILKDDYIITTSLFKNPVIDSIINQTRKNIEIVDKKSFVLLLFEKNVSFFLYYLKHINIRFIEFEQAINHNTDNKDFISILQLQKSLIYFETNLRANNLMQVKMKRTNFLETKQDEIKDDIFDEIIIDNQQAIEMSEVYSRIVDSSMGTVSSIISNNVNNVMKRLTGATIIIMVPSLIASLWGMNLNIPLASSSFGFAIVTSCSILIAAILALVLYKKNWM
jgi:magnesium transporter